MIKKKKKEKCLKTHKSATLVSSLSTSQAVCEKVVKNSHCIH